MKISTLDRKKFRVRNKLKKVSSKDRFRLCVSRSTKNISAQIIDDVNKITLVSASSVEKNIREQKKSKSELSTLVAETLAKKAQDKKIKKVLEKVGIVELIDRLPSEMSGGQQSRAALARVLLQENPILLLDEPFSALGPNQKSELIELVYSLSKEQGITVLLITHDPKDAKQVGGQCIVVKDKKALGPFETSEALKKDGPLQGYL